jgi:hypothetical protein
VNKFRRYHLDEVAKENEIQIERLDKEYSLTQAGFVECDYHDNCKMPHISRIDDNNRIDRRIVFELTGHKIIPEELEEMEVGVSFCDGK